MQVDFIVVHFRLAASHSCGRLDASSHSIWLFGNPQKRDEVKE